MEIQALQGPLVKPRVLLDCDGVLAAFVDGWLKLINSQWGTSYTASEVTDWDVCASLGIVKERRSTAKKLIATSPGFANKLDVLPGAREAVEQLREIAEIYVVTSPWESHPTWTFDRNAWLDRHFGIGTSHIIHTSAKHVCAGDLFIDDKTAACSQWRTEHPNGIAVLWSTPHNARDLWDGACTSNWDHLINMVRRIPNRKKP